MPGDPKECRRRAAWCAELAVAARTPQLRATFLELSKNWEKLAIQLENAFAYLAESEDIKLQVRESLDETQRLSGFPLWKRPYSET
jgi:undecaprenyl pyrophosphate synthase